MSDECCERVICEHGYEGVRVRVSVYMSDEELYQILHSSRYVCTRIQ